jgi:hypothetical protein
VKIGKIKVIALVTALVTAAAISVSAYWGTGISMTGTANAATMGMKYVSVGAYGVPVGPNGVHVIANINNSNPSNLIFNISNLYPSDNTTNPLNGVAIINAQAINNGSIGVKYDKTTISVTSDTSGLVDYLDCNCTIYMPYMAPVSTGWIKLTNLNGALNTLLANKIIGVGQTVKFHSIKIKLSDGAPEALKGANAELSISMDYKQLNQ